MFSIRGKFVSRKRRQKMFDFGRQMELQANLALLNARIKKDKKKLKKWKELRRELKKELEEISNNV